VGLELSEKRWRTRLHNIESLRGRGSGKTTSDRKHKQRDSCQEEIEALHGLRRDGDVEGENMERQVGGKLGERTTSKTIFYFTAEENRGFLPT